MSSLLVRPFSRRGSLLGAHQLPQGDQGVVDDEGQQTVEVCGVRMTPGVIKFTGAFIGQTYKTSFHMQNVGERTVNVKISNPYSWAFTVSDIGKVRLSPGLKTSRVITFVCGQDCVLESTFPVQVENQQVHFPIVVSKGESQIQVVPTVLDFGMLDLGCPFVSRYLTLSNVGRCTSRFAIDLGPNKLDILASPKTGRLAPNTSVTVRVEMAGFIAGEFSDEFWVKCTPPQRVRVNVTILVPHLQACHPNRTDDFTLIEFQPTFYGCERFETLIVRNVSSEQSISITMAEIDSSHFIPIIEAQKEFARYRNFAVHPIEGRIGPFECRIFTIMFNPKEEALPKKGWSATHANPLSVDCFIFARIHRVDVIVTPKEVEDGKTLARDAQQKKSVALLRHHALLRSSSDVRIVHETERRTVLIPLSLEDESDDEDRKSGQWEGARMSRIEVEHPGRPSAPGAVRLCLYGAAIRPKLAATPDTLCFGRLPIPSTADRVLRLDNPSDLLPIRFAYRKIPYLEVKPSSGLLGPRKSIELKVTLKASSCGSFQKQMVIDLLAPSNMTDGKNLKVIGQHRVGLTFKILTTPKRHLPRIYPGITPAVSHEVGEHTELVTYRAVAAGEVRVPDMTRRLIAGAVRTWKNHPHARVALPNDMPKSLRPKAEDKSVVALYTGMPRYLAPEDSEYILSEGEMALRDKTRREYAEYTKKTGKAIRETLKMRELPTPKEYPVSCKKLYQLLGMEYQCAQDCPHDAGKRANCMLACNEDPTAPRNEPLLVPITPTNLYNIQLTPNMIDFGMIPQYTECVETLMVENRNNFPVFITLIAPSGTAVTIPQNEIVVEKFSKVRQKIYLFLSHLGKYCTNITYVINSFHKFEIKVTANVVHRVLHVTPKEVTFGASHLRDVFQDNCIPIKISNPLTVPTRFSWKVPGSSPYRVVPAGGVVNGLDYLWCCVCRLGPPPTPRQRASSTALLQLLVHRGTVVRFKCSYTPVASANAVLLLEKINVGPVPIGIRTVKTVIMFNAGNQDLTYTTEGESRVPGVRTSPLGGVIKARCCSLISVMFTMDVVQAIDLFLEVDVHSMVRLKMHLTGYVPYPKMNFSPPSVVIRHVERCSYCSVPIVATNKSPTMALLQFKMSELVQFKVSPSSNSLDPGFGSVSLAVEPGKSVTFFLHYSPDDVTSYMFYLPMVVNRTIGPPNIDYEKSLRADTYIKKPPGDASKKRVKPGEGKRGPECDLAVPKVIAAVKIDCTVAVGKMSFSQTEFNFLLTTSHSERAPQVLSVTNEGGVPLRMGFDSRVIRDSPFSIACPDGTDPATEIIELESGESVEVTVHEVDTSIDFMVTFNPGVSSTWMLDVPVFAVPAVRPYRFIRLTGIFHSSTLTCQNYQLYFLPVPLGVVSERRIEVLASHQERASRLEACIMPAHFGDSNVGDITFEYPQSPVIPAYSDKFVIPVVIRFSSSKTTSFRTFVDFYDGCGGEMRTEMFAIADTSILTTYAYLSRNKRTSSYVAEDVSDSFSDRSDSVSRMSTADGFDSNKQSDTEEAMSDMTSYVSLYRIGESIVWRRSGDYSIQNGGLADFQRLLSKSEGMVGRLLTRTVAVVEEWLFEQGFQCQFRWTIGQHIAFSKPFAEILSSRAKNPCQKNVKSIVDLIVNLCGREFFSRYSISEIVPTEDRQRILHCHNAYRLILEFLKIQGACLCHVTPLTLFDYDDYVYYFNNIKQTKACGEDGWNEPLLNVLVVQSEFEMIGLQSWLDVILQLYKVAVLKPSVINTDHNFGSDPELETSGDTTKPFVSDNWQPVWNINQLNQNVLTNPEHCLVMWLNATYEAERNRWENDRRGDGGSGSESMEMPRGHVPPPRAVTDLCYDLEDAVVLSMVTAYYCPYLVPLHLHDIFLEPEGKYQNIHNAVALTQAWKKLRLGLSATPSWFSNPNPVQMLMLVTHLYTVLPSYVPRLTVFFSGSLSTHIDRVVSLNNPSNKVVRMQVKILGDPNNSFKVVHGSGNVLLKPKESLNLNIQYFAKRLYLVSATLLICGCVLAGGFCSNVVYRLEGEATDLTVKESFKVSMPIYAATFLTLHILAPYKEQATYELWYSETEPTHGKLEELSQWRKVRQLKVPRQLFLGCDELVVPGTDSIRLTPLQQEFEKKEAKRLKTQEKEGGMAEDECVTRLASESAQEFCLGRTPRRSMHQLRDQEPGVLPLYAACYRLRPSSFWLIFSNKKVGDFIIKITLMGRDCPTALTISVPVLTPGGAESPPPEGGPVTSGATCGRIEDKGATPDGKLSVASEPEWETSLVPVQKVARVFLPWRNSRLWTTVRAMFFLTLEEKEKPFWTNHLETRIGLKLVKWMLGSRSGRISEEINQIFKKEVTYTLTSSSPLAQFNSRLTIPDILDNSYVELLVNISEEATSNFSTILTLVAEDKEEMRKYEIKFNFPHRKCSSK